MATKNIFFLTRETAEGLNELDAAAFALGYKDRSDWYRDMKRQTIAKAKQEEPAKFRKFNASQK
jgi:metal-responsive CopG/Arc/MetJ family transcriptional regulator